MTKPESGNKYYNTIANGGYSGAIVGQPTDKGCNVLANCVGYAAGRFNEIIGQGRFVYFKYPPNAEDFYDTAVSQGLKVGKEPKLGAIIVWAKGKTWTSSDGAGHVAVVEQIQADGSIITSESGWGCASPFWTSHRYKGNGNWGAGTEYRFLGFVYLPEMEQPVERVIKKGDKGADVELMQARLAAKGYLRKSEVDGDFGTITLGALLAFQFEHNLDVDGLCGPATRAELTKN
jgi:surface antigen